MSETVEFWKGDFGRQYTERNRAVDWKARVPFWKHIADVTEAISFLEVGCNIGTNLKAIREVLPEVAIMSGVDVNRDALAMAQTSGFDVVECAAAEIGTIWLPESADIVFTSGVMIHVSPDELPATMQAIVDMAKTWVLAVEYADTQETEVEYRGHAGRLWRRPYGDLYQARGLSLEEQGEAQGFDACRYWLLRKGA